MTTFAPDASRLVCLMSLVAVSGCSQEPSVTIAKWDLTRAKDRKSYLVEGVVAIDNPSGNGFFHPLLNLVFEDGCRRLNENLDTIIAEGAVEKPISYKLETSRKIASAVISV